MKYSKQVSLGFDLDGKRVRKRIYADSQQELKRKEREILQKSEEFLIPGTTFEEYKNIWLEAYKKNREANTLEYYETALKKLSPLDSYQLKNIKRTQIQSIIRDNWDKPVTCRKISITAGQIFSAALADGLIARNPAAGLELPKVVKHEKRILTSAEKDAIESVELPEKEKLFLMLERRLGLRPEETRGLTKAAISFKDKTLTVSQASAFDHNRPVIKDTKNHKHRTLPLDSDLLAALRKRDFIIFPNSRGELMTKTEYRRFSERIFSAINAELGGTKDIDVLNGMTFYTLRHTRGTELYYFTQEGKISTKLAAEYMGHSEMVFLSTYSHIDREKESLELLRKCDNL